MPGFKGEQTLMRIHIGERDRFEGRPLCDAVVELLRERHYAGATVLRAIMGFGAGSHVRTDHPLALSEDLPLVIECVETEERIQAILPELDAMIGGGLITLERARVIMYRPDLRRAARRPSHEIDITGHWQVRSAEPSVADALPGGCEPPPVRGSEGERVLMRMHLGESDRYHGRASYEAIVELLHQRHYAGATVLEASTGFGASSTLHTEHVLRLSSDLSIIVECIDTPERIEAILPALDAIMSGGLITLERAHVITDRAHAAGQGSA